MLFYLGGFFSVYISELEKIIIWSSTFATQAFSRLFKCEQCKHEETHKYLLSTHKRVSAFDLCIAEFRNNLQVR